MSKKRSRAYNSRGCRCAWRWGSSIFAKFPFSARAARFCAPGYVRRPCPGCPPFSHTILPFNSLFPPPSTVQAHHSKSPLPSPGPPALHFLRIYQADARCRVPRSVGPWRRGPGEVASEFSSGGGGMWPERFVGGWVFVGVVRCSFRGGSRV